LKIGIGERQLYTGVIVSPAPVYVSIRMLGRRMLGRRRFENGGHVSLKSGEWREGASLYHECLIPVPFLHRPSPNQPVSSPYPDEIFRHLFPVLTARRKGGTRRGRFTFISR